ncbi:MAG: MBL fold metallo-hydrolase [candidate division Zixibacteria bacterium]|nr:MBL fold metallo-hydrolase [candidate division Zixibacteria bacterium]
MPKRVTTIVVGAFMVNCYLYWDDKTGDGVIIDPGDEGPIIIDTVRRAGFTPRGILLTHGHVDHIAAVGQVKEEFDIPLYVGRGEEALLADPAANASIMLDEPITVPEPEFVLKDEQEVRIGSLAFRVLATPGHTPGGICYLDETEGLLFCGDTLFQGSIGRTDLPGGSYPQLIGSIQNKLMKLPDGIVCFSGHGPRTTIGAERNSNPFLTGGYFV